MSIRKVGVALAAVCASLLIVPVAAGAATPQTGSPRPVAIPPLYTATHLVGVAKNGSQFKGSYGIQRFVVRNNAVYAIGTLKGTFRGRHITRYGVLTPASLNNNTANGARDTTRATNCSILHLVLGPINLDLLGLDVVIGGGTITPGHPATAPITINIDANSGGGLLGNLLSGLLCNNSTLSGLLTQINSSLQSLSGSLNQILASLGL